MVVSAAITEELYQPGGKESRTSVYFSGGFIEAHFLYFVGVGVVALYEDWVPFGIAIGYVAGQHSVFGLIEWFTVYNHPAAMENPVIWGGIHAVFVSMLSYGRS